MTTATTEALKLTDRINRIEPSATMAVVAEADKLRAQGIDVVDFGAGEPDFPTPDHIKQAAIEALASGCALIATPVGGLAEVAAGAGEIVDASDIPALAAALRRVATDTSLRAQLQQQGRAKAREVFDIRRVTEVLDTARGRLAAEL